MLWITQNHWGILCDLTNAFDCINQGILLSKLRYCGITGIFYSLIKPYLEDRHQRVKLVNNDNNSCSSMEIVKHGVPQGSVVCHGFQWCATGSSGVPQVPVVCHRFQWCATGFSGVPQVSVVCHRVQWCATGFSTWTVAVLVLY